MTKRLEEEKLESCDVDGEKRRFNCSVINGDGPSRNERVAAAFPAIDIINLKLFYAAEQSQVFTDVFCCVADDKTKKNYPEMKLRSQRLMMSERFFVCHHPAAEWILKQNLMQT